MYELSLLSGGEWWCDRLLFNITSRPLFASCFNCQNQVEMLVVFVSANHRLDVLQLDISLGSVLCCDNAVLVVWLGLSIKPLGWG